jgi:hypothetical protein
VIALAGALAIALALPPSVLYRDYCSTLPLREGQLTAQPFCISYDPALGRYENPPPEVPADVSRFAMDTANPNGVRAIVGGIVFSLIAIAALAVDRARRRSAQ